MNPTDAHPQRLHAAFPKPTFKPNADGTLSPARAAFLRDYLGRDPAEAAASAF